MFSSLITKLAKILPVIALGLPLLLIGLNAVNTIPVSAQSIDAFKIISVGDLDGDGTGDTIGDLLVFIQNFMLSLAAPLAVLVIMYGGYKYFLSSIDDKANGLKTIQAGVIGLAIVLLASAIGGKNGIVQQIFGNNTVNTAPIITLITNVTKVLLGLSTAIAVLVIVWGGYQYFFAGLGASKADGLKTIQNGVTGLVVVVLANAIVSFVESTVKSSSTNINSLPEALGKAAGTLLGSVTGVLVGLAVTVTILVIVYGGYQYFFGGFDGKSEGRANIEKGVTGLVVVLLANFIASTVNSLFGSVQTSTDFTKIPGLAGTVVGTILNNATDALLVLASVFSLLVIVYGGYQYLFSSLPQSKANGQATITNGVIGLVVVIIAKPIVTLIQVTLNATDPLKSTPTKLEFNTQGIVFVVKNLLSNLLVPISSVITVFFVVLAAYQWITSNGNADQVKKAQESIRNAIIGFVVVLIAVSAVQLIVYFVKPQDYNSTSSTIPNTSGLNQTTNTNSTNTTNTTNTTNNSSSTSRPLQPSLPLN